MLDTNDMVTYGELIDLRNKLSERIRRDIKLVLKELLLLHPHIKGIDWVQYTPYFNDGDICEFSADNFHFTFWDVLQTDDLEIDEKGDHPTTLGTEQGSNCWISAYRIHSDIQAFDKTISGSRSKGPGCFEYKKSNGETVSIALTKQQLEECMWVEDRLRGMEEDLKAALGDHVRVVLTLESLSVHDYEHD